MQQYDKISRVSHIFSYYFHSADAAYATITNFSNQDILNIPAKLAQIKKIEGHALLG